MNGRPLDAGVAGVLSPDEAAAQLATPVGTIRARVARAIFAPRTNPEPEAEPEGADRPYPQLEAEAVSARNVVMTLQDRAAALAETLEATERRIEEARTSLDPASSAEDRETKRRIEADLAELDLLIERAEEKAQAAERLKSAGWARLCNEDLHAKLEALVDRAAASDAAISAAVDAVFDLLEARAGLLEEARELVDAINGLPERYWIGPRSYSGGARERQPSGSGIPASIRFDRQRIPALARQRKLLLGI